MGIPTYFSHSYRVEDQQLNQHFWQFFSGTGFSFFVDPPSDITSHSHLERMMGRCSAFVAVVNRRRGAGRYNCSPFVLYEYGLSIQARRPRLLLIDKNVSSEPFQMLSEQEKHVFSPSDPASTDAELAGKIIEFAKLARSFPNQGNRMRGKIGLVVRANGTSSSYAEPEVVERLKKAARLSDFTLETVPISFEHTSMFALQLETYEAVVLDVRGDDLPAWVFAYAHGRLVPTIKLVHLKKNELAHEVVLPELVTGLRMDEREPGVESLTYWRDADDLVWQLEQIFCRLDEDEAVFKDGEVGNVYFESIGRRPGRVFISNAGEAGPLARQLANALKLRNISYFHYKEPDHIESYEVWEAKIRREVARCDVFVALTSKDYKDSRWCRLEAHIARKREDVNRLPFSLDTEGAKFWGKRQAPRLSGGDDKKVQTVLEKIQSMLRQGSIGDNRQMRRTTLLGASREAVVDALRHVNRGDLMTILQPLPSDARSSLDEALRSSPVRPRRLAEAVFRSVERSEQLTGDDFVGSFVARLATKSHLKRSSALESIAARISSSEQYR